MSDVDFLFDNLEYGTGGVYNMHIDGRYYAYGSRLRPDLHMKPNGLLTYNFVQDTHIIAFLENAGIPYDVVDGALTQIPLCGRHCLENGRVQFRIAIRAPHAARISPTTMDIDKLSRLKLSLLTTFQVLLQERSAGSAAKKLNLSQSAVSKNLAQLRVLFDDPLFYRTSRGLTPTPLAKNLEGPLCEVLFQMDNLLNPVEFVADDYRGRVRIAMHDAGFAFIGAPLMALCEEKAPGIQMDFWFKDVKGLQALLNAEIDLLILPQDIGQQWHDDEHLIWRELYQEPLLCLLRSDHPALKQVWNEKTYLACSHIGIRDSQLGMSMLDQRLNQQHHARVFSAMAPDFHTATRLVQQTDSVFTCSHCWAELVLSEADVVKRPLPFQDQRCAYQLVWHKRTDTSPLHVWLRERICDICDELKLRYGLTSRDKQPA